MKHFFLHLLLLLSASAGAQNFNGTWEGLFHTDPASPEKDHSFFVHLEVKQDGLLNGFYYIAPQNYSADREVISEIADLPDKQNLFNLSKPYQLYNKINDNSPDLSFEFHSINYLINDTSEFLYGKWLPAMQTSSADGADNVFWLRKVDSNYDAHHKKTYVAKIKTPKKAAKKIKSYEERRNVIAETFQSHEKDVNLEFYDNGVVDGDVISVYVNNEKVLDQRKLTVQPIKLTVPLEKGKETTVTMFAETLGVYPPNTAVMIINSGYVRKTVFLSADFDSNVSVTFKTDK